MSLEEDLGHVRFVGGEFPRATAIALVGQYTSERTGGTYKTWWVHDDHRFWRHDSEWSRGDWIGEESFVTGVINRIPVGKVVRITVEVREEDQPR